MCTEEQGWIKIHRKFIKWEWYDDTNTKLLFLHLLLTVNWEEKKWRGLTISRGQIVTSISKLAQATQLSVKQVRTSLNKLTSTNELACTGASKYTIITVCKYDAYQVNEIEKGKQKGKQTGNQRATTKEDNTIVLSKKDNTNVLSISSPEFEKLSSWILENAPRVNQQKEPLTNEQLGQLLQLYSFEAIQAILLRMHNWAKITRNVSTYLTAKNWLERDAKPNNHAYAQPKNSSDRIKQLGPANYEYMP